MDIEEKVRSFIEKEELVEKGDRILLGLSGGADSVCLFYLLLALKDKLGFALRAVHIHHGIRPEAEADVSFVARLCEKEKVPCYIFREDVPAYAAEWGLGEEEAGRILRYQDFQKGLDSWREEENEKKELSPRCGSQRQVCPSRYKAATAHHENDQAETVLFQLFRGCGLSGLRGILPKRENIIRPMLCLSRADIEAYLGKKGISWCEDKTNESENYSRNRIRHQVLSAAAGISQGAVSHIGRTAEIVREAESYIKRQAETVYKKISAEREGVVVFQIPLLLEQDIFLQKQLLLYGLERVSDARKDIGAVHVEDIRKLMQKQGNGELCLPNAVRVRKFYQKLAIFRGETEEAFISDFLSENSGFLYGENRPEFLAERIRLSDEKAVKERFGIRNISEIMGCIPEKTYTKWFDYDKIETSFSLRHWVSGDYLTIDRKMNHKSFRRYLIETKIPVSRRNSIWLFADGAHVMWVPGGRMSAYYKITEQTKNILQIKICADE